MKEIGRAGAEFCCLQVLLGQVLHQLDQLELAGNVPIDDLLAVALLVYFGIQTIQVGYLANLDSSSRPPLSAVQSASGNLHIVERPTA